MKCLSKLDEEKNRERGAKKGSQELEHQREI
jgi:hypothetical protein